MGFSGWASITDLDLEWFLSAPTTPERNREIDEFHQRLCERYVLPNKSKFAKQPLVECPYENYIFWFLTQMYARFSSRQVGQRRGKTLRMCSCPVRSGAVVCRSIDGRLRGPPLLVGGLLGGSRIRRKLLIRWRLHGDEP